jgi:hypothetical protein
MKHCKSLGKIQLIYLGEIRNSNHVEHHMVGMKFELSEDTSCTFE